MTIVGTRPEIIRLSRVMARLDEAVEHVLVHTGQNYDYELNQMFFEQLNLRHPDHYLGVDTSSLGTVLGETLIRSEQVLSKERPDAVLMLGDTNSAVAALIAKRMRIPTYHMEAGNRCFNDDVPEETNRKFVDHIVDFNLVYTEHARRNLLAEGIPPRRIMLTGSPMWEVIEHHRTAIDASTALRDFNLTSGEYFVLSAHREENVDRPERLDRLLDCLEEVRRRWSRPIFVSTHPRTRKRLIQLRREVDGVIWHSPIGFHDYVHLQQHAFCVLSDSGTVSEESAILNFPAVTLRESIERPEALDAGTILMAGLDSDNLTEAIKAACCSRPVRPTLPPEYLVPDVSERTLRFIISTYKTGRSWRH